MTFPMGALLLDGRWRISEALDGSPFDGRYRCTPIGEAESGTAIAYLGMKRRAWDPPAPVLPAFRTPGIVEFLGDDAVPYDGRVFHALVEREPGGTPVQAVAGEVPLAAVAEVAAALYGICASAHAHGSTLLGIRPEVVYVRGERGWSDVAVMPRWPWFRDITVESHYHTNTCLEGTYFAPEIMCGKEPAPPNDIFSVAATIAFLATGRHPFAGELWHEIEQSMLDGRLGDVDVDSPGRELLLAGLAQDPAQRPVAADLAARWSAIR